MSVFDGDREFSKEEIQEMLFDEAVRRRTQTTGYNPPPKNASAGEVAAALGLGSLTANEARKFSHSQLGKAIKDEYEDIRRDPERQARQMDQMERTYQQYLDKTGNPVEAFIPMKDMYAAATLDDGTDVVIYDPSAPHAAIMAHELGHINMNHQTNPFLDPLAALQTSGLGRWSGNNAEMLGAVGAALGAAGGAGVSRYRNMGNHMRNQAIGTAIGGAAGVLGGSGQFAYELGGASGRAFGYLPEDVDKLDAAGDLTKAGLTYALGGPLSAATTAAGVGSVLLAAAHPGTRRYVQRRAGDLVNYILNRPASGPSTVPSAISRV